MPPKLATSKAPPIRPPHRNCMWRYEDEALERPPLYRTRPEHVTMRVHGNGRFQEFDGILVYVEGWLKLIDHVDSTRMNMELISDVCGKLGLTGYSSYYYRKSGQSLKCGLVHLKTEEDVASLKLLALGVKCIDFYVVKIEEKAYKEMLRKDIRERHREVFCEPTITEISDSEALGLPILKLNEKETGSKGLIDDMELKSEYTLEYPGLETVRGPEIDGAETYLSDDDSIEDEDVGCYATEKEALEDLGPLELQEYIPDEGDVEIFEELRDLEDFEVETEADSDFDPELSHHVIFNKHRHLDNPVLIPEMIFGSTDEFKRMIRKLAIETQRPLKFTKNDKDRVRAECRVKDCPWVVLLSRHKNGANFCIKTIKDLHTCGSATRNKMLSVKFLAERYLSKVRLEPGISLQSFMGQVSEDLGVEIGRCHAWRAIRAAGHLLYGNEIQQFAKLWSYAEELRKSMPGSTIKAKLDESKFERIYICLAPLKEGFKAGCRRFVCLDGCFLKGAFKGQLLAAVGCDPDNGIYPIAWAVVEVENTSAWTWFVKLLKEDLGMHINDDRWIVMTDQQKGLEKAIKAELPNAEHRLCVKHLHANWSKRFSGKAFKDLMWEASRAANDAYFDVNMEKIRSLSQDAYEALNIIPKAKWTRCGFKSKTNCPMLVNNWAEAFNKVILKAREQPILSLLNSIHCTVMQRLCHEHEVKSRWPKSVCPRVDQLIRLRESHAKAYVCRPSGTSKYSVTIDIHGFVVDIATRECSCGLWQLSGVPCIHAVRVYQSHNKDARDYVHHDFSKETFLEIYSHFLLPIRGPMNWPKTSYLDIQPPDIRVLPGRPKRRRRIDASEAKERAENEKQARLTQSTGPISYKAGRKGLVLKCGKCGATGHNARTCGRKKDGESSSETLT